MSEEPQYRKVKIKKGPKGWGGPLIVQPKPGKDLIYSVTGGGIHPLAQQIAVCVIDCGGTARVGVYPMKKVLTVDIYPTSPSGPLMRFITPELFCSGVRKEDVELIE
jgi:glucitol/sorbitol PTS system EIIB component